MALTTEAVPLPINVPHFDQRTILGGVELLFTFHWNARAERWFMSVADQAGSPIIEGVKLVPRAASLWERAVDTRLPLGVLMLVGETPGLDTLGVSGALLFVSGTP